MNKPKVAFYWCASCGGCEEAVVDLAEDILKVVEAVDVVFWPVALDIKKKDVENMEDGSIAVTFINGAIRLSEQEEMVKLLRKKSQIIVAFGSCAHLGGIPALANFATKDEILNTAYLETFSTVNPQKVIPQVETEVSEGKLTLPEFFDHVYALDQVIDVDYYLPGCSVPTKLLLDAINAILTGKLPPKGSVLAPNKTNCDTCDRNKTKPEKLKIDKFYRPYEIELDPEKCFLAQGVICLGPVTRGGCEERCIKGNMPCRGCMGPVDQVYDQGAKFVSAIASLIDSYDEKEIDKIVETIVDPAGTFYRFSLSKASLKERSLKKE
ncbi:MAG: oxidoreductase [Candidatus Aminicenantia bacterium]